MTGQTISPIGEQIHKIVIDFIMIIQTYMTTEVKYCSHHKLFLQYLVYSYA